MPGRGRGSASQAGLGSNSGRAKVAGIAGYHSRPMVAPLQPDPEKLAAIRAALPATVAGIYLNTGTSGPLPAATVSAMRELEDWEERVGRADPAGWDAFLERMDECRGVLAALLSAGPESIALTHSTTDGMNIATWGVDWRPGDRALTTNAEHPGLLGPLVAVRDRAGVALDIVDVEGGGDPALIQERIAAAMTPRTRLVSLSHVLWTTGAVLPVVEIGRIARERGVWYAVDAAQSAGAILVDAEAIGADFIAFPGQKWLLGPEGTGALWASPRAVAEALPVTAGWLSFATPGAPARRGRGRSPGGRPRSDAGDAAGADGHPGLVPRPGLDAAGAARGAIAACLRHHAHGRRRGRAAHLGRLLQLRGRAGALRRGGRRAGAPHAGPPPPPARARDPAVRRGAWRLTGVAHRSDRRPRALGAGGSLATGAQRAAAHRARHRRRRRRSGGGRDRAPGLGSRLGRSGPGRLRALRRGGRRCRGPAHVPLGAAAERCLG